MRNVVQLYLAANNITLMRKRIKPRLSPSSLLSPEQLYVINFHFLIVTLMTKLFTKLRYVCFQLELF